MVEPDLLDQAGWDEVGEYRAALPRFQLEDDVGVQLLAHRYPIDPLRKTVASWSAWAKRAGVPPV